MLAWIGAFSQEPGLSSMHAVVHFFSHLGMSIRPAIHYGFEQVSWGSSRKLSGVISAGYTNPFVMDSPAGGGAETIVTSEFPGIIGHVELRWFQSYDPDSWRPEEDASPAAVYQYVANNTGYLQLEQKVGRKMKLRRLERWYDSVW